MIDQYFNDSLKIVLEAGEVSLFRIYIIQNIIYLSNVS